MCCGRRCASTDSRPSPAARSGSSKQAGSARRWRELAIGKGGTHLSSGSSSLEKRPASSRLESHERVGRNPKGDDAELIYYLHIPKTAGTSVIHFLHDVYDPVLICPYGLWDELVHASSEELAAWRVYVGHFGGVLPLWLRRWPRTLTVLRDPVARTISHIRHVKRDFRHPLHRLALGKRVAEYLPRPHAVPVGRESSSALSGVSCLGTSAYSFGPGRGTKARSVVDQLRSGTLRA